jgi:hypothetical protein
MQSNVFKNDVKVGVCKFYNAPTSDRIISINRTGIFTKRRIKTAPAKERLEKTKPAEK